MPRNCVGIILESTPKILAKTKQTNPNQKSSGFLNLSSVKNSIGNIILYFKETVLG
jgi:hypothetical protein